MASKTSYEITNQRAQAGVVRIIFLTAVLGWVFFQKTSAREQTEANRYSTIICSNLFVAYVSCCAL